MQLSESAS